jgi:hypothetical protein
VQRRWSSVAGIRDILNDRDRGIGDILNILAQPISHSSPLSNHRQQLGSQFRQVELFKLITSAFASPNRAACTEGGGHTLRASLDSGELNHRGHRHREHCEIRDILSILGETHQVSLLTSVKRPPGRATSFATQSWLKLIPSAFASASKPACTARGYRRNRVSG